ncbi:MAG: RpiB/LacA/LacB family sugar-phosphate isomerase, partial [Caldilineaceae bacterium]
MCWTGSGAFIAANKVNGIRAAPCHDAETAKGARTWNHVNVLAFSLRATSEAVAKEILDASFTTPYNDDDWNLARSSVSGAWKKRPHPGKFGRGSGS